MHIYLLGSILKNFGWGEKHFVVLSMRAVNEICWGRGFLKHNNLRREFLRRCLFREIVCLRFAAKKKKVSDLDSLFSVCMYESNKNGGKYLGEHGRHFGFGPVLFFGPM